jgi:hypothetical protein
VRNIRIYVYKYVNTCETGSSISIVTGLCLGTGFLFQAETGMLSFVTTVFGPTALGPTESSTLGIFPGTRPPELQANDCSPSS